MVTNVISQTEMQLASSGDHINAIQVQVVRQIAHWTMAANRLNNLDDLASPSAWEGLERYVGRALRRNLGDAIRQLQQQAKFLHAQWNAIETAEDLKRVQRQLVQFRKWYFRTETLVDFYVDAINTRTTPTMAGLLRACDRLCHSSMGQLLKPLNQNGSTDSSLY